MNSSPRTSSFSDAPRSMGNSRICSQSLFRSRIAAIYGHRVARICRDCRISDPPSIAASDGGEPPTADNLERRSDLFIERCREEWLGLHIIGMLLSGTVSVMLTNGSMRANTVARTAALLSLEYAIASAAYAGVYVWRIVPATKKFPSILRHAARHPTEYTHVWAIFALPIAYLACSILFLAVAFLVFIWTSGGTNAAVPQHISAPLWSHLLLVIGAAHPFYRSLQVWETFNNLCEPVKVLDPDKV